MADIKLRFWELVYIEFMKTSNGLYTYRISSESYSNINPVEPIGHHHEEVIRNVTINKLRTIFSQHYHNPYLCHIYIRKRRDERICIIYRYELEE